jgi:predicted amidohydrolase
MKKNIPVAFSLLLSVLFLTVAACHPLPMTTEQGALDPPPPGHVRVAGVVLKWLTVDKQGNFERLEPLVREAAANGAQIVVTAESFLDGYAVRDKSLPIDEFRNLGEPIPDGTFFRRAAALADELNIYFVAGMNEAAGADRYNTAVFIGPDGVLIGRYRKQAIGHEAGRNTPGTGYPVFKTRYGTVGVMICEDRRHPEIANRLRANGAELLIVPSGGMYGRRNDRIVGDRARENGVPIVFVHPVEFLVTGSDGTILARAMLGDQLAIEPGQRDGAKDSRAVFYFDLEL